MNRIKELRENIGLSQEKLAKNLSINLRTLQRWENDETAIRKKNAEKIANYFNVSVPYLLGYTAEIDDSNDWGKIVSISSQDPDYEAVKAGKSIFQSLTPPNSDKILENNIFEYYVNFYKDGKTKNKHNLSEEDLEKFFGEQHISHSSSNRLNHFYQAVAVLEAEEAAVLSCFSLLSKEKKAAVYEILVGLISPDNK